MNSQPGWLYEGNAVLHPRGSEYQTQFVVDGIPLTDNRSPSFGPAIDADDVQSMTIYTAGIPAEYGRKMGGVVEVNTLQDAQPGFHGQVVLSGGSFDTAGALAQGQYVWGKNTFGASASGSMTDHYLNPVVPQNYSNTGTLGDFSVNYERDLTSKDRLRFIVRHELSRYDIPNEQVQQAAGQRQTRTISRRWESLPISTLFRRTRWLIFAAWFVTMRTISIRIPQSTPIEVFQHNFFREGYFKGDRDHRSRPATNGNLGSNRTTLFLNENFSYIITDPSQFDPDTPPRTFSFVGNRPGSRAIGIRAGSDPVEKLDDQCRPALGSLPAVIESAGSRSALCNFALLSRRPIWFCIFLTIEFFRRRHLKIFCFRVRLQSNRSIRRVSCGYPSNLRKEITTKPA